MIFKETNISDELNGCESDCSTNQPGISKASKERYKSTRKDEADDREATEHFVDRDVEFMYPIIHEFYLT